MIRSSSLRNNHIIGIVTREAEEREDKDKERRGFIVQRKTATMKPSSSSSFLLLLFLLLRRARRFRCWFSSFSFSSSWVEQRAKSLLDRLLLRRHPVTHRNHRRTVLLGIVLQICQEVTRADRRAPKGLCWHRRENSRIAARTGSSPTKPSACSTGVSSSNKMRLKCENRNR